jgi:integration host factor subunit beta
MVTTVTKADLVQSVVDATGCTKGLTMQVTVCLFEAMREALAEGNRIEVRGFGIFQVKNTKAKPGARNPRTNEVVYVPARRKAHFKPSKLLREGLRKQR